MATGILNMVATTNPALVNSLPASNRHIHLRRTQRHTLSQVLIIQANFQQIIVLDLYPALTHLISSSFTSLHITQVVTVSPVVYKPRNNRIVDLGAQYYRLVLFSNQFQHSLHLAWTQLIHMRICKGDQQSGDLPVAG